jgi:hypothetical protein
MIKRGKWFVIIIALFLISSALMADRGPSAKVLPGRILDVKGILEGSLPPGESRQLTPFVFDRVRFFWRGAGNSFEVLVNRNDEAAAFVNESLIGGGTYLGNYEVLLSGPGGDNRQAVGNFGNRLTMLIFMTESELESASELRIIGPEESGPDGLSTARLNLPRLREGNPEWNALSERPKFSFYSTQLFRPGDFNPSADYRSICEDYPVVLAITFVSWPDQDPAMMLGP